MENLDLPAPSKRLRTIRRGRASRQSCIPVVKSPRRRRIPVYELLDNEALVAIEGQADWILENIGVEFRGDETALDLFAAAGATVVGDRVKFEPGHARSLCATAPDEFQLHGRDPTHTVTLGGCNVVLMPGYGSPFVSDLEMGRRYATLEDFENFVKLTYGSP